MGRAIVTPVTIPPQYIKPLSFLKNLNQYIPKELTSYAPTVCPIPTIGITRQFGLAECLIAVAIGQIVHSKSRHSVLHSGSMKKTPMMAQYDRAKKECGDALLLFRMGDFYELFHADAEVASQVLGLTLTSRDKSKNAVAMAGFPHHQLDSYLGKLIKKGYRVAVCEQVEDPKTAKGLVKREISQIVSPGTVTDESLLDPSQSNYLGAIVSQTDQQGQIVFGLSWLDLSTGHFIVATLDVQELISLTTRLKFSEYLVSESDGAAMNALAGEFKFTKRPAWSFARKHAEDLLKMQLAVATLDGFGIEAGDEPGIRAAGGVLQYVRETQDNTLQHIDHLAKYSSADHVEIDQATWRSLEISQTSRFGNREGSLFAVIDRSITPMGSRQLGIWLTEPLRKVELIRQRQAAVSEFFESHQLRNDLRTRLKTVLDLQRLLGRATTARCAPRQLAGIAKTLAALPAIKAKLSGRNSQLLQQLEADLDLCSQLRSELERALVDPCPAHLKDGGCIKSGFNQELDGLRELAAGGKKWIADYQQTICERTGIPSLKVGFNKVFGYYLEVTNTHRDKIPPDFIRKQTLKNAERYITPELKEYEEKVLAADEKALALEHELFASLRSFVLTHASRLKRVAQILAMVDALSGLAELAATQSYCCPQILCDDSLIIVDGRHPVLDIVEPTGAFIPNDTTIDDDSGFVHLITGPNMAGKSTYIRQVALITLMAQIGSFVPAGQARIGVVDRIYARIGASDELTRGQSTFMVEMTETARILNTATSRSLVILDEIGRGTSTYDGVSLAWSIVEYIHDHIGCRTLFATHYHELTSLESTFTGVKNYNVSVQEWDDKIVFLHKIVQGAADKSYGIHVSRLAGVPEWVSGRAEQILQKLEADHETEDIRSTLQSQPSGGKQQTSLQMTLFEVDHPLVKQLRKLDANHISPLKALQILHQWKSDLED